MNKVFFSIILQATLLAKWQWAVRATSPGATNWKYAQHDFFFTCLVVPNSVCLDRNAHVIAPPAVHPHLVAYWSFDHLFAVDESGQGNHFHPGFRAGPPVYGIGASAHIHSVIPNSAAYVVSQRLQSSPFTVGFWLYLLKDEAASNDKLFLARGPSLSLGLTAAGSYLRVTVGSSTMQSQAAFLPRRWTHVALVVPSDGNATVYWNGMEDISTPISPVSLASASEIVLGHPSDQSIKASSSNFIEAYIDELRIFDTALSGEEVASMVIPSVTGIEDPSLVKLGCVSCNAQQVNEVTLCGPNYHVCFKQELYDFGFRIARIQGFLKASRSRVWYGDALPSVSDTTNGLGEEAGRMALCCAGPAHCVTV